MISIVQKNLIVDHKCLLYGYVFFELFMQEFSFGVLDHFINLFILLDWLRNQTIEVEIFFLPSSTYCLI